jgi:hypothetical protein
VLRLSQRVSHASQGVRFREELDATVTRYGGVYAAVSSSSSRFLFLFFFLFLVPSSKFASILPIYTFSHASRNPFTLYLSYDSCFDPSKCTVLIAEEPSGDK